MRRSQLSRAAAAVAAALLLAASAGEDPVDAGLRLLREGKYKEALEALRAAVEKAGSDAPAALHFDEALAALASGDLPGAEGASERAAARDPRFERGRDFVRGNVAFARCEAVEHGLEAPPAAPVRGGAPPMEIDPAAYDIAIAHAESARDAWIAASQGKEDWPAARRNVERALNKIEELRKKKEEAQKKQEEREKKEQQDKKEDKNTESRPQSRPEQKPESQPNPDEPPKDPQQKPTPQDPQQKPGTPDDPKQAPPPKELSPEQIQRMLDKLDDKEKQRLQLQKARARVLRVPKDW